MSLGHVIRGARIDKGWTQAQLANELNKSWGYLAGQGTCTAQDVSRWENNRRRPTEWRPHIERVLGIDLSEYGRRSPAAGITASTHHSEVGPVQRRSFFLGASAAMGLTTLSFPARDAAVGRVGQGDVHRFRQRVADLRRLDDYSGGAVVVKLAMEVTEALEGIVQQASYSEDTGKGLLSALSEAYQFASWGAFDAGETGTARRLALISVRAANQAGDRTMSAITLSQLSYITASSETPEASVGMARAAVAAAPDDNLAVVQVVLADRLAWACARTGDAIGAEHALHASQIAHEQRGADTSPEPDMLYWINADESRIKAGRCWAELGKPSRAVTTFLRGRLPYDKGQARSIARHEGWLAATYIAADDVDQAVHSATRALDAAQNTASPRTNALLGSVLEKFEPHKGNGAVAELLESCKRGM